MNRVRGMLCEKSQISYVRAVNQVFIVARVRMGVCENLGEEWEEELRERGEGGSAKGRRESERGEDEPAKESVG